MRTIQNHCEESLEKLPTIERERVRSASIQYWCLALAGEIGELCNLVKKETRDQVSMKEVIAEEMADILIYLCMMANSLGVDLEEEFYRKQKKNIQRFGEDERGTKSQTES
ncbi:MAG: MazG-like family protein [Thermoplasmata archaeon]